jgi:hypothetical protein
VSRRARHRQYLVIRTPEMVARVAEAVHDDHARWLQGGMSLMRSSAVYIRADGGATAHLVYRDRSGRRSATVTVRELVVRPA